MSNIKNGHISIYFNFNKIIKGPETSFQSPVLSQKQSALVFYLVSF